MFINVYRCTLRKSQVSAGIQIDKQRQNFLFRARETGNPGEMIACISDTNADPE